MRAQSPAVPGPATVRAAVLAVLLCVASIVLAPSDPAVAAVATPATISPATGGAHASRVVVLSGPRFADASGTPLVLDPGGTTHGVSFAAGNCAANAAAGSVAGQIDAAAIEILTTTRMSVTVPGTPDSSTGLPAASTGGILAKRAYTVCVYAATPVGSVYPLLAKATYTVYPVPTLAPEGALVPAAGPSSGGLTVTVLGDTTRDTPETSRGYFTAATTATLGGVRLTGVTVAADGNSFSGVAPALPPGPADLVVTTEGGSVTLEGAYTSLLTVAVTPRVSAPDGGTLLTVAGSGFLTPSAEPGFGVLLVAGGYDPAGNPGTPCTSVHVVSDTRLTCVSPPLPEGPHLVVVTDMIGDAYAGAYGTVLSSTAVITAGPF